MIHFEMKKFFVGRFFWIVLVTALLALILNTMEGRKYTLIKTKEEARDGYLVAIQEGIDMFSPEAEEQLVAAEGETQINDFSETVEDLAKLKKLIQDNYLHLNQWVIEHMSKRASSYVAIFSVWPKYLESVLQFLTEHNISEPFLYEATGSFNQLASMLRLPEYMSVDSLEYTYNYGKIKSITFDWVIFLLAAYSLEIALLFTEDQRKNHIIFPNIIPTTRKKIVAIKMGILLVNFLLSVMLAAFIFVIVQGLNPNYGFGTLQYPFAYRNAHDVAHPFITTIGQYLLPYFGYLTVWAFFMTSLGFLVSRFTKEVLVVLGVLCLPLFMNDLGLQSLLGKFASISPTTYLPFTSLLLDRGDLMLISDGQAVGVLLAWSILFLALSSVVIKVRGRI